jgi:hypothetical protein
MMIPVTTPIHLISLNIYLPMLESALVRDISPSGAALLMGSSTASASPFADTTPAGISTFLLCGILRRPRLDFAGMTISYSIHDNFFDLELELAL